MKWTLTNTFDYHSPDVKYWKFDTFDEAKIVGDKLTSTTGILYLWKETIGQPIKWMKLTYSRPNPVVK